MIDEIEVELVDFRERHKVIDLQPFPYELRLIVSNDIIQSEKNYRKKNGDLCSRTVADAGTGAITLTSANLRALTIIAPYKCDIGYIAHEVCHVVNKMFQFVGARYESEVWAYYQGWLTREAARFVYEETSKYQKSDVTKPKKKAVKKPLTRTKRK